MGGGGQEARGRLCSQLLGCRWPLTPRSPADRLSANRLSANRLPPPRTTTTTTTNAEDYNLVRSYSLNLDKGTPFLGMPQGQAWAFYGPQNDTMGFHE